MAQSSSSRAAASTTGGCFIVSPYLSESQAEPPEFHRRNRLGVIGGTAWVYCMEFIGCHTLGCSGKWAEKPSIHRRNRLDFTSRVARVWISGGAWVSGARMPARPSVFM